MREVQLELWPVHVGGWLRGASVFLDHRAVLNESVHVVDTLRAISGEHIRSMRRRLLANPRRVIYSRTDNGGNEDAAQGEAPDAWDILLRHLEQRLTRHTRSHEVASARAA